MNIYNSQFGDLMKRFLILFLLSVGVNVVVHAQTGVYPNDADRASNAVEAPAASIDLIRQSAGIAGVAGVASFGSEPVQQRETTSSSATVTTPTAPVANVPTKKPTNAGAKAQVQAKAPAVQNQSRRSHSRTAQNATTAAATKTAVQPVTQVSTSAVTATEKEIETKNALLAGESSGGAASAAALAAGTAADAEEASRQAIAQEELDYAARLLQQARENVSSGRFIPPAASESAQAVPSVASNRPYNPKDFRPGVEWIPSSTTHFTIYTQKRDNGISSSNMGMTFESAYSTLRRNIPWMMSDKVRVFVYQDHNSYLKHEPNAKAWTRALAYPTRGEIVVYDEPGKQQELKEVFTHELVHIFTQKFFDKYKTGRLMTPSWLDEGLAVYMEDQAYNGSKGGPWANDFKTLNFQRSKETQMANFSSSNMFGGARSFTTGQRGGGKPLYFMPFDEFMQEGSLASMEGKGKAQDWYFQAYSMVRFLLNPAGSLSPSNRMQFEQFTRLMSQGEQVRDPRTGFPAKDRNGKPVYKPYSAEKALGRSYRYNSTANFEDAFWRWADGAR